MKASSWSLEHSPVSSELKRFIAEKCAQVRAEVRAPDHPMGPESSALFAAADRLDWRGVIDSLAAMCKAVRDPSSSVSKSNPVYPVEWAVVNEIGVALEEFACGGEKYAIAFGQDIISVIPPGSIYFGGTDAGRFLVTALCRSHVAADPFFTVTQNALVDFRSYLRYVRGMYGSQVYIPTDDDVSRAFREYQDDLRRRHEAGKLAPGEHFQEVESVLQLHNHLAVMSINGALSKLMFERNPGREFYLEESFPLQWMYPHLSPYGLILKLNRQALPELSEQMVEADRHYWCRYVIPMIGDWLSRDTSLAEVAAFVERVHVTDDLAGFAGDPLFIRSESAQRNFSKLRAAIGGLYAWRAQNAEDPLQKERMLNEADFAFRQAFALCPGGPEAVFRYINFLLGQKRREDAILVAEAGVHLEQKIKRELTATRAHLQEDFSHKPQVPSRTDPAKLQTQLEHLLETLQNIKPK